MATSVLKLSLEEASAKVRTGGPIDDPDDFERRVWAGVLPFRTSFGSPIPDSARAAYRRRSGLCANL